MAQPTCQGCYVSPRCLPFLQGGFSAVKKSLGSQDRCALCPIQSPLLPFLWSVDLGGKCRDTCAWGQWLSQSTADSIYLSRSVQLRIGLPLPSWPGGRQSGLVWWETELKENRENRATDKSPMFVCLFFFFPSLLEIVTPHKVCASMSVSFCWLVWEGDVRGCNHLH